MPTHQSGVNIRNYVMMENIMDHIKGKDIDFYIQFNGSAHLAGIQAIDEEFYTYEHSLAHILKEKNIPFYAVPLRDTVFDHEAMFKKHLKPHEYYIDKSPLVVRPEAQQHNDPKKEDVMLLSLFLENSGLEKMGRVLKNIDEIRDQYWDDLADLSQKYVSPHIIKCD